MDNSSYVTMGAHMMLSSFVFWVGEGGGIVAKLLQRSQAWNICMMCCHGGSAVCWKVETRRKRPLFVNFPQYVVSSVPWSAECV